MKTALDWLFPKNVACFLCGREAFLNSEHMCAQCAEKLVAAHDFPCPTAFDGFVAGAYYNAVTAPAIRRLKYEDARYLGADFALLVRIPDSWKIDVITAVPLFKKRLRERGYNQSELIARALSSSYNVPFEQAMLERVRDTGTQTELGAAQRAINVRGAFKASANAREKRILLLDDVYTTGATMCEAAAELRRAGASAVYGAAVCITPQESLSPEE